MAKQTRKQSSGQGPLLVFLACVSLVALALISTKDILTNRESASANGEHSSGVKQPLIFEKVYRTLTRSGVAPEQIEIKGNSLTAHFKREQALLSFYQKTYNVLRQNKASSIVGTEDARTNGMRLRFKTDDGIVGTVRFVRGEKLGDKAVAIIIDDFGYHRNAVVRDFIDLPISLTYAIIPGLPFSTRLAEELHEKNKTILVHMPMEPLNARVEKDGYTLLTSMTSEEISLRMRKAMNAIPFAIGMNNHMGSKATADSSVMLAALRAINKPDFLFVDSRTSSESVAYALAASLDVQALRNNIFLDPTDDQEAVEKSLLKLAEIARANGSAIGIGHPRPNTLAALRKLIPQLQEQGFQFVTVSDLRVKNRLPAPNAF